MLYETNETMLEILKLILSKISKMSMAKITCWGMNDLEPERKTLNHNENNFLPSGHCQSSTTQILPQKKRGKKKTGLRTIDHRFEVGRFAVSASYVTISNPGALSSSEMGLNSGTGLGVLFRLSLRGSSRILLKY
jgi:hypothetical protein